MSRQAWIDLGYPEAIAGLARRLAVEGEWEEARRLLRGLLWIEPAEQEVRRLTSRVERWAYQDLCKKLFPDLVDAVGIDALALAADLLRSAIESEGRADKPIDHSEIWRPAIEAHHQNVGMDLKEDLIDVVRDAALHWIDDDAARLEQVVRLLGGYEWNVYLRLALYLRAEKFELDPSGGIATALDESSFFNEHVLHEYAALARAALPAMDEAERARWHSQLDNGPEWPPRKPTDRAKQGISDEDYKRLVAIWRRDRLALLEDGLPSGWKAERDELIERYGAADHPDFHGWSRSWVGPTSPLSEAELGERDPQEVVEYLASWTPSGEIEAPTPDGLGRLVSGRVADDPDGFAKLASDLKKLDPTYIRAALSGFEQAAKKGGEFEWGGAVLLCEVAASKSGGNGEDAQDREGRGWDPDWRWCRKEAASLIETGLREDLIPTDLSGRIWVVLSELSWDPEPTPEYEEQYGGSNMDPLTLSINTTRGEAMHAVVQYATWRKQHVEDPAAYRLAEDRELAQNLEDHLDPEKDPSETIRAVYGSRLAQLYWIDPEWLAGQIERLFPEDDRLRLAAWESFLVYGRPHVALFPLLKGQYGAAVDALPTLKERRDRAGKEPGFALAEHIATFYWWGEVGLEEEGVVARFAANAAADEVAHFLDFIGRSLDSVDEGKIDDDVQERLTALWEQMETWTADRPPEERRKVLGSFGWWYGSNALDPKWSDETLIRLLDADVQVDPEFQVGSGLESRASQDLQAALEVAQAFVRSKGEGWRLFSVHHELRQVLAEALRSDKLEAQARQVVDDLVAKGQLGFQDLLPGDGG
jgi:hypothetical protein